MALAFDQTLDVKGVACPLPLVKSRKALGGLAVGQVLRVLASDRGSVADFQGWAKTARGVELLAQETEEEDGRQVYVHYVRRAG